MRQRSFSSGVVVVRETHDGWRVLLLRAYNVWDCPKGEVTAEETPLETARREVLEETGIVDLAFLWGDDHVETPPYGSRKKVARYYLAAASTDKVVLGVSDEPGLPEHHEFRWCTFDEAASLVVERVGNVLAWARNRIGIGET